MLAQLMMVPNSPQDWAVWSLHHKLDHDEIQLACNAQLGTKSNQYCLDPIPMDQIQEWLTRNQQSHNEMNGPLGLQGTDLEDVDFNDKRQLEAWIFLHYQEHYSARSKLRI